MQSFLFPSVQTQKMVRTGKKKKKENHKYVKPCRCVRWFRTTFPIWTTLSPYPKRAGTTFINYISVSFTFFFIFFIQNKSQIQFNIHSPGHQHSGFKETNYLLSLLPFFTRTHTPTTWLVHPPSHLLTLNLSNPPPPPHIFHIKTYTHKDDSILVAQEPDQSSRKV